jgi:hypothetical protein
MKTLQRLGWKAPKTGLLRPPLIYVARKQDAILELYFQSAPGALSAGSRYRALQKAHAFAVASGMIPDLVIRTKRGNTARWLLIEVKGGPKRGVADSARAAAHDLLAYRRAFAPTLAQQSGTYGIGYAWGAQLQPAHESEIVFCTPDTLTEALAGQLGT